MRLWDFTKVRGSSIQLSERISAAMGLEEGNQVYSVLFKYEQEGSKSYELILSAFGPDSYRNLSHVTIHMRDEPGALAQAAKFLSDRGVNVLNSVSLSVISDVGMVWKILVDLGFCCELDLIVEDFVNLVKKGDGRVSKLDHIEVQRSEMSRIFTRGSSIRSGSGKMEQRRAGPDPLTDTGYSLPTCFQEILGDVEGNTVMMVADPDNWLLTVTFLRDDSRLVKISLSIPDSPGAIHRVSDSMASMGINLLSVFTKVQIYHQRMILDAVADIGRCDDPDGIEARILHSLARLDGDYELKEYSAVEL